MEPAPAEPGTHRGCRPRLPWHVAPTDDELDRLEAIIYIRTLYLVCSGYRRAVKRGGQVREWGFIYPPEYYSATAAATRAASGVRLDPAARASG